MGKPGESIDRVRRQFIRKALANRDKTISSIGGRSSKDMPAGSTEKLYVMLLERQLAEWEKWIADETSKLMP